jgi:uncharacterized protein YjbI with pentapeptide repeats
LASRPWFSDKKAIESFEPPKYLATLISGINDGAKAAQAGTLVFGLVALYLLATAFSVTDEDLLIGRTTTISQLGASLPASFSFAIAPLVFVLLHIYTLSRYHMLGANLQHFLAELQSSVHKPSDQERCRQLLANVEYVHALTAPVGSRLHSPIWRLFLFFMLVFLPIAVLLLIQITALRYQSETITTVQRSVLILDLGALMWFSVRSPRHTFQSWRQYIVAWIMAAVIPALVLGINFSYFNIVEADDDEDTVHAKPEELKEILVLLPIYFPAFPASPLDLFTCPYLGWGCRYLRVDHRTFVNRVWDPKAVAELRSGKSDTLDLASAFEGIDLRNRSLRFAVLDGSFLAAADMTNADLRKATLADTWLSFSRLRSAQLQGADLNRAHLQHADLYYASLRGANLSNAQMQNARLSSSDLTGTDLRLADLSAAQLDHAVLTAANLFRANLEGANLEKARLVGVQLAESNLNGANLRGADLLGADLTRAQMITADLLGARLSMADLEGAYLIGTNLSWAALQGAHLADAQAIAADLSHAFLWRTRWSRATLLALADLRGIDFSTRLTKNDFDNLSVIINRELAGVDPASRDRVESLQKAISELITKDSDAEQLDFHATSDAQVLVDNRDDAHFNERTRPWLTNYMTVKYKKGLIEITSGLAEDTTLMQGISKLIVDRLQSLINEGHHVTSNDKSRYRVMGCTLSDYHRKEKNKIDSNTLKKLSSALRFEDVKCDKTYIPDTSSPSSNIRKLK